MSNEVDADFTDSSADSDTQQFKKPQDNNETGQVQPVQQVPISTEEKASPKSCDQCIALTDTE